MRRLGLLLFLCLPIAACSGGSANPDGGDASVAVDSSAPDLATAAPRQLTLLYSNDEHSHLFAFGPEADDYPTATTAGTGALVGGVARRKVVLDAERAAANAAGSDVLTVSAGDEAMGTLTQVAFRSSQNDYAVMKSLGYDVACLGNHEFDLGPDALARAITGATSGPGAPQLVASNIHFSPTDTADDALAALYGEGTSTKPLKRYHVVTTPNGLKVGFFGILGASAAYYAPFKTPVTASGAPSEESNTAKVLPKIFADIQPTVDALRNTEKVDLVVALSHSGVDLTTPDNGEDYQIAKNVPGIDVIVSGHTHTEVPAPIVAMNTSTQKPVVIVQAGSYGKFVGRLPLTVGTDGKVSFDAARAQLVLVDDKTIPDPATAKVIDGVVDQLESQPLVGTGPSFLEGAISRVVGGAVKHDPNKPGDLYFYPLGKTTYDMDGLKSYTETPVLDLSADAELAAAQAVLADPPDLAIQAAGVVRADIQKGKTGVLTFGDAFRTFPLGFSPADGTLGYPVVHTWLYLVEIKGAFEVAASYGLTTQSVFYLVGSGVRVTVDSSRPAFDATNPTDPKNGRVTKIEWDSQHRVGQEKYDTVLFDVARTTPDPWTSQNYSVLSLLHVVSNLYVASFAASQGVTLKDKSGATVKLADTIIKRADGTEVKDYEAFAGYLKTLAGGNGGTLPSTYDVLQPAGHLPKRILCSGPLCTLP